MWAVVHIAPNRAEAELTKHMLEAEGMERKKAVQEVARQRGLPKRDVYRLVVEDKKSKEIKKK